MPAGFIKKWQIILGFDEPFFESKKIQYGRYLKRQSEHTTSFNLGEEALFAGLVLPYQFDEEKYLYLHDTAIKNVRKRYDVFLNKFRNMKGHSTVLQRLLHPKQRARYLFCHRECEVAYHTLNGAIKKSSTALASLIEDLRAFKDDITMSEKRIRSLEKEESFLVNLIPDRELFIYYKSKERPFEQTFVWESFVDEYNCTLLIPQKYSLIKHCLIFQAPKDRQHKRLSPRQERRIIDALLDLAQYDFVPAQMLLADHFFKQIVDIDTHSIIAKRLNTIPEFDKLFVNWVSISTKRGHQSAKRIIDNIGNYLKFADKEEQQSNRYFQIRILQEKISNQLQANYLFTSDTELDLYAENQKIIQDTHKKAKPSMFTFKNIVRKVTYSLVSMRHESDQLKISIDF